MAGLCTSCQVSKYCFCSSSKYFVIVFKVFNSHVDDFIVTCLATMPVFEFCSSRKQPQLSSKDTSDVVVDNVAMTWECVLLKCLTMSMQWTSSYSRSESHRLLNHYCGHSVTKWHTRCDWLTMTIRLLHLLSLAKQVHHWQRQRKKLTCSWKELQKHYAGYVYLITLL